jgi:hypothetical protein
MDSPSSIKTEKPHAAEVRVNAALTILAEMGHPADAEKDESVQVEKIKRESILPPISSLRCQRAQLVAIDETRDDASLVGQATSTNGGRREVLMSHSDTLKYIITQEGEEEEGVLMSHTDTLKYLLKDCGLVTINLQDVGVKESSHTPSLEELQDTLKHLLEDCGIKTNLQDFGVKESSLMPSLNELQDKLKHLLQNCGINATDFRDVEVKESTPKPSLKELRIKSALIERDIKIIESAAVVNNLSTSAVNVIIDELRMKNESIKRDIDATEVAEAGDGNSLFKLALPSGIFSVARCASTAPPELSQCKDPSTARNEAGINCVNPQKKDGSSQEQQGRARGEYDEVLMSHADTLKYLLKDCGIAGINRGDPQNKDGSSQKQQERAQGKEEAEVLMSHADTLRYLLKDCGIGI